MSCNPQALAALKGAAQGQGSVGMMLELLAVLNERGVLSEADVRRVVGALAAELQLFDAELRGRRGLKG
ncbi:hypothetical protein [Deinococcus aerophilus]|uniref:Uncharacterized protein n=1 Tax=Deinococcus aerophilus TaxID=522488 RepID=A0ABQ2GY44_9DEIO|nr:hypothetical protein [Deinococcus aerophilus]GGM16839.1 hypothetical protein GCM10010841_26420 [Deinococcus aerophilus]